ncbi:MAG TPA: zinc transporter ZupT, partial [Clostridiaceae bacterium]|nr:zinc transporter ZupT [Clostridiaceae bacterium]
NPHEPCSLAELEMLQGESFDPATANPEDFDCTELRQKLATAQAEADIHPTAVNQEISEDLSTDAGAQADLYRTGLFSALAIAIHNFPEGLATFMSALADPALGLTIAVAIAIHNIPEGISVAVPIYYATGSRRKAVRYALLSGLAEPLGALFGALILLPFLNDAIMGFVFAGVAGIMVYISIDELLPTAEKYGEHHYSIYGLIVGMAIMAISLQVL